MVSNGILDDVDQLLLRSSRSDGQPVQQLNHETGKPLKGSRNAHRRADLDQDVLLRVDINLQFAGLVDRRVKEGE